MDAEGQRLVRTMCVSEGRPQQQTQTQTQASGAAQCPHWNTSHEQRSRGQQLLPPVTVVTSTSETEKERDGDGGG